MLERLKNLLLIRQESPDFGLLQENNRFPKIQVWYGDIRDEQ